MDAGDKKVNTFIILDKRKRQGHKRRALSHDTVPWQSRRASYVPLGAHLDEAGQRHARALCFRPLKATRVQYGHGAHVEAGGDVRPCRQRARTGLDGSRGTSLGLQV